jgi:uncharacterized protein involved in response to NO
MHKDSVISTITLCGLFIYLIVCTLLLWVFPWGLNRTGASVAAIFYVMLLLSPSVVHAKNLLKKRKKKHTAVFLTLSVFLIINICFPIILIMILMILRPYTM